MSTAPQQPPPVPPQAGTAAPAPAAAPEYTLDVDVLLRTAVERGASDLHLKVGQPPIMRLDGRLVLMDDRQRITGEQMMTVPFFLLREKREGRDRMMEQFKAHHELDLAYSVPRLGRFRVNLYRQRGTIGVVFRIIPTRIPAIRELNLPAVLEKLAMEERGLILVTGTTGSGKSTSLASMIDFINKNKTSHVMTIEDPIEYLFRDEKSLINQREVGFDTEGFSISLRQALRQDPDIIMVGEMRDKDTISTALTAAETGHLVMSTLHTTDATETVNRIISVFEPHQQYQIRLQLASVIKGIVSMRLVPRADGKGRVPAVEVLIGTTTVKESIIDKDKTKYIPDLISSGGSQYGMQTFDQALLILYKKELITYEEALRQSTNPEDFALKVRGVQSTSDLAWDNVPGPAVDPAIRKKTVAGGAPAPPKIERFGDS